MFYHLSIWQFLSNNDKYYGVKKMNITWSGEEENDLRVLYNDGYRTSEIAKILNEKYHCFDNITRNPKSIRAKAFRMGIKSKFYRKEVNGLYYCSHCKTYKEKCDFRSNKSNKNKIGNLCKKCEAVYRKRYREKVKYLNGCITDKEREKPVRVCDINGCETKHYGLGYCKKHYAEFKKYGIIKGV